MSKERASLGFDDALDDFDPGQWAPKPAKPSEKAQTEAVTRKAADVAGFQSREPAPPSPPPPATPVKQQRRRRTGRNAQFNIKARPDTIEAFCAVADAQDWGLGETLEHAVALLQERYGR